MPRTALYRSQSTMRLMAVSSLALVLVLIGLGAVVIVATLEIQSAGRAYVTGESLWSKGQHEAVYSLDRYAATGRNYYLERARAALGIPLGDRRARLALNQDPPDLKAARAGFLAGANDPRDVPEMIWLYRYFHGAPYFRDAVELWRRGDKYILQLSRLADDLSQEMTGAHPSPAQIERLRAQLERINGEARPVEEAFSATLGDGARWLKQMLFAVGLAVLVGLSGVAAAIFWWATRKITASEFKFRAAFEHAAVGMAQLDCGGRFNDVNDALCEILALPREKLLGAELAAFTHPADRDEDRSQLDLLTAGGMDSYTAERRLLKADGSTVWCKLTASRVSDAARTARQVIAVIEDISEARKLSSELKYQARHDALTGLINRREFEARLARSIETAREERSRHVLCFVDLDQFKVVNDTCGHMAGDELLRQTTDILRNHLRRGDVLARLGGDEFGVIFSHCAINAAADVADKLRRRLAECVFSWEDASFNITASMGLVEIGEASPDVATLLREADTACYLAKDHGRNRLHVYNERDHALVSRRDEMEWVGRIREALDAGRLRLYAQIIEPVGHAAGLRYELLVRLIDRQGREVLPGAFLPAAERYNVATSIDRWVVCSALRALAEHPAHQAALDACHINLSGQSIGRDDFLQAVEECLDRYSVDPGKICFEITETAAMTSMTGARRFIERLNARGCRFALDDFGSGLSSFGYLRALPVDVLKIDGTFVRDIVDDEIHLAMVKSINEIGRLMGKRTVAEFVESEAIFEQLRLLQVDYVQGYAIHKPCPLEDLLSWQLEVRQQG